MKTKINNFVAKHAQRCGAGRHAEKNGRFALRARQKRNWKREVREAVR